jgi:hypothetical protein
MLYLYHYMNMKRFICGFFCIYFCLPLSVGAETEAERKLRLEAQLQQVEKQILQQRVLVDGKKQERQTLERDLDIIDAEITQAQLGIEARSVAIAQLSSQIGDKAAVIGILNERLVKQRASLGELLRQTQSYDDYSMAEVFLSNENLSDFFTDADRFKSVKKSLNDSLSVLKEIRQDSEIQKMSLEEKQLVEAEMKRVQELEKMTIEEQEAEKERILKVTRGEEAVYQQLLEATQKTKAQIQAQLFALLGGGGAIPFPRAVELAQVAGRLTGVPASLILAILEQESTYGSNIGRCTMGDVSAGRDIMHPDRDKPVFLAMAPALGFDAATQQVSCPLMRADGSRIGWGGAMGPSQFIPSTWAIYGGFQNIGGTWSYVQSRDAIRSLLGKTTPSSPFMNQDAFTATSLLLRDNGANGTYASDRLAALRYYAGWGGASSPANAFYGDGVMRRKARLEGEIKVLTGS